jgi:hypothetical protein
LSTEQCLEETVASKIIKRYDKPKTPYRRILKSPDVSLETKHKLKVIYKTLNPFELRKTMEVKLKDIHILKTKRITTHNPPITFNYGATGLVDAQSAGSKPSPNGFLMRRPHV